MMQAMQTPRASMSLRRCLRVVRPRRSSSAVLADSGKRQHTSSAWRAARCLCLCDDKLVGAQNDGQRRTTVYRRMSHVVSYAAVTRSRSATASLTSCALEPLLLLPFTPPLTHPHSRTQSLMRQNFSEQTTARPSSRKFAGGGNSCHPCRQRLSGK